MASRPKPRATRATRGDERGAEIAIAASEPASAAKHVSACAAIAGSVTSSASRSREKRVRVRPAVLVWNQRSGAARTERSASECRRAEARSAQSGQAAAWHATISAAVAASSASVPSSPTVPSAEKGAGGGDKPRNRGDKPPARAAAAAADQWAIQKSRRTIDAWL